MEQSIQARLEQPPTVCVCLFVCVWCVSGGCVLLCVLVSECTIKSTFMHPLSHVDIDSAEVWALN